jgi:hypothetical protein
MTERGRRCTLGSAAGTRRRSHVPSLSCWEPYREPEPVLPHPERNPHHRSATPWLIRGSRGRPAQSATGGLTGTGGPADFGALRRRWRQFRGVSSARRAIAGKRGALSLRELAGQTIRNLPDRRTADRCPRPAPAAGSRLLASCETASAPNDFGASTLSGELPAGTTLKITLLQPCSEGAPRKRVGSFSSPTLPSAPRAMR